MQTATTKIIFTLLAGAASAGVALLPEPYREIAAAALANLFLHYGVTFAVPAQVDAAKPKAPVLPILCLALALWSMLSVTACGLFGKGEPLAPVASCAPVAESVVDDVAAILLAGGDYVTALENYGKGKAADFLTCAVRAYLDQPASGKMGASPADAAARERGKAYLASKGAK